MRVFAWATDEIVHVGHPFSLEIKHFTCFVTFQKITALLLHGVMISGAASSHRIAIEASLWYHLFWVIWDGKTVTAPDAAA